MWYDRLYLSGDPSLDESDQLIGVYRRIGVLDAGSSYTRTQDVVIPDGILGDFNLLIFTDSNITPVEHDECIALHMYLIVLRQYENRLRNRYFRP